MAKSTTNPYADNAPQLHVMGLSQDDIVTLDSNVSMLGVSSWGSVEVKKDWVYTDPAGHNHDYFTYGHSTRQPTKLEYCRDCHEDHEVNDGPRRCRWCDEEVEPEYRSIGAYAKQVKGSESHYLVTAKPVLLGALVIHGDRVLEVVEQMEPGEISYGQRPTFTYVLAPIGTRHHTNDANLPELMPFGRHERKQP